METIGLTSIEVKKRFAEGLNNKSSKPRTKTITEIFAENIFSLFNFIIFGIILFVLFFYISNKDHRLLLDSIGILVIAVTNTSIAIYQEIKAKRALDKVNLLLKKEVTVIRDGKSTTIEIEAIVKDDIIQIKRGDQIVVDGVVTKSNYLEIDESLLTGESVPVDKTPGEEVLSGSFCISGNGNYKAEKVGENSYANSVTNLAKKYKFTVTPLQRKINLILKILFGVSIFLVGIEIISWNIGPSVGNPHEFVRFIRKIATILISLVPQGLVLMSSVTFALGVYRISKIGAIVQRLNAIESFSNIKVVCMDKTGTLTQNKLKVHSIINLDETISEDNIKLLLGTYSYNSSEKNATIRALDIFDSDKNTKVIEELPFNSTIKLSILKLNIQNTESYYILGAFDILAEQMNERNKQCALEEYKLNNLNLYRNLLFGKITNIDSVDLKFQDILNLNIEPICIVSITDTIREDVYDALNLFKENGISFKILSGDSAEAISAILKEIGWDTDKSQIINGKDLDSLTEQEFEKTILDKSVFGRLKPEHKLKIIKILKRNKIHTAMIGDGVNDLPAIKQADIGIAMEEGSSITKEVADIILLKNKFSLLPEIFNEGNKIVNSVKSVAKLFLTKNFLVIYLSVISLLFFLDFPLTPRRVSLLNIFAIGFPALMITLKNQNISRCLNFSKDTFSFVIVSAGIIVLGGYTGYYVSEKILNLNHKELDMVMMTIMIFLSVVNFVIVAKESGENHKVYIYYGILLILVYSFFAAFRIHFFLFRYLNIFYEIEHITASGWVPIFVISSIFSVFLYLAHKIREKIVS